MRKLDHYTPLYVRERRWAAEQRHLFETSSNWVSVNAVRVLPSEAKLRGPVRTAVIEMPWKCARTVLTVAPNKRVRPD